MRELGCDWNLVTAPVIEPIDLDDAKLHAGITQADEDSLSDAYVRAVREAAEQFCNRGILTQTWALHLSGFADVIPLPMAAPLQSITSITYYDVDGTQQTLAASVYQADTTSTPGRVLRKPDQDWPSVQCDRLRPVTVTYVVGWTEPDLIPESLRQGMRVYFAALDGDRTGEQIAAALTAAQSLWTSHQVYWQVPVCP